MTTSTSARTTTLLSLLAGALVLGLLLFFSGPGTLTPDQLDQLRRSTDQAEQALHLARLGCELLPVPEDRASCHLALAGAEVPVKLARGILATSEACGSGSAGEACRTAQAKAAEQLLPEVRRVVEQLQARPLASASASASASATLEPPEVPDPPASASAPVGPPRPGEGGQ